MAGSNKNLAILFLCQILFMSNNSLLVTVGGLVGLDLAADKALATMPITSAVVGTALMAIPASLMMRRLSRRTGFMLGALIGLAGGLAAAYGVFARSFWLLAAGSLVIGMYVAFAQLYRFAAAESVSEALRPRAISLVLLGGVGGGYLGPQLAKVTIDLIPETPFLGPYFAVTGLAMVALALLSQLDLPPPAQDRGAAEARPLLTIMRSPVFFVAALSGMLGYLVMALIMTGTPLAMVSMGHSLPDAASVIQWHLIGMFLPSLFTGRLVAHVGVVPVLFAGSVLQLASVGIALSGIGWFHFVGALALLGVGWNFLFIAASTLLTKAHTPAERAKTQAVNDFLIFATVAAASLSAGQLLHHFGWRAVLLASLVAAALVLLLTVWAGLREFTGRRRAIAPGG